ncbi:putative motile sperm domain-containing protein 1 [Apostichopus japonicus]|uniref:Putative motile sperm domain-containing protein 1 n=1 Tax=Stichopus japonicus TaxID=307972 RepID=A0A2G8LBX0_STIJA|nr:putative motile sperm domain-containing protein 1 [Apostichopus japonicus]
MHWDRHSSSLDGNVPVFVFPTELTFYADDLNSHKQILTLYNPYGFILNYKVLSTAPQKYIVGDSHGLIQPGCCVDIVVRHRDATSAGHGQRDKFRISVSEQGKRKAIGHKDVPSILLASSTDAGEEKRDNFSSIRQDSSVATTSTDAGSRSRDSSPSSLIVVMAVACISALLLPTQGDKGTNLPDYLHLTMNQKLIAAYVLGLVTMVLLRV